MKNIITVFCLLPSLICAMIVESDQMHDILPQMDSNTLVLVDIDNTLLESSLHLGSVQWRTYIKNKALELGNDPVTSDLILDKFWLFVQYFIPVKLVDPEAPNIIQIIKNSNVSILALTAREPLETDFTQRQLHSVGISLSNNAYPEQFSLPSPNFSLYEKGVIYCGDNTKSQCLLAFFQYTGYFPKKVIFVDDRRHQVEKLEKTVEQMGIEFVGIRFSGSDERVNAFDPDIAELQFQSLPKILSDEEAKRVLGS